MNLLHVGDLHLGRSIDKRSLIEDQQVILDQILQIAHEHTVSGIILAGDVFDSTQPSEKARKLYNQFVKSCLERGIELYVIAGNHDSRETVEFAREALGLVGVHTAGVLGDTIQPLVHRVNSQTGDTADTVPVHLWLLPYVTRHQLQRRYAARLAARHAQSTASDQHIDGAPSDSGMILGRKAQLSSTFSDPAVIDHSAKEDAAHKEEDLAVGDRKAVDRQRPDAADSITIPHVSDAHNREYADDVSGMNTVLAKDAEEETHTASHILSAGEVNDCTTNMTDLASPQSFTALMKDLLVEGLSQADANACNILVAHQFVVAGNHRTPDVSDSEQQVYPSNIFDAIEIEAFDGMDYVALGHLHKPQEMGDAHIRYAGTPLVYSKSEANQEKSVTLIRITDGNVTTEICPLHPLHAVRTLEGSYEQLRKPYEISDTCCDDYVYITLTDSEESRFHYGGLRERYPYMLGMTYKSRDLDLDDTQIAQHMRSAPSVLEQFGQYFVQVMGHELRDDQERYLNHVLQMYVDGEDETCVP